MCLPATFIGLNFTREIKMSSHFPCQMFSTTSFPSPGDYVVDDLLTLPLNSFIKLRSVVSFQILSCMHGLGEKKQERTGIEVS